MKLLLASGGLTNDTIRAACERLLGKPIAEASALAIPTAEWGHPYCTPFGVQRFAAGAPAMVGAGWKEVGILELAALPSIGRERWEAWVRAADVLLVDGGDAAYLCHWIEESGLADLFDELSDTVWVGCSAGSMVMTPRIGPEFVNWPHDGADDTTLGLVDFSIFPHLDHPMMPDNTLDEARRWWAGLGSTPAYALDDDSAILVVDGQVEVVSEGQWHQLA